MQALSDAMNPVDEDEYGAPHEAHRGEVVFALAKGVAFVVASAACLFLGVLMIFAKTFIMSTTGRLGLLPLLFAFVAIVVCVARHMGVSLSLIHRIYLSSLT